MKNSRLTNLALGAGLGLLVAVGSGVVSGCVAPIHYQEAGKLRRQLQTHGEFRGQNVFTYRNQLIKEAQELKSKGKLPDYIKNVNQFYDWKKQQEPYESDAKAKEDALKAQESGRKY